MFYMQWRTKVKFRPGRRPEIPPFLEIFFLQTAEISGDLFKSHLLKFSHFRPLLKVCRPARSSEVPPKCPSPMPVHLYFSHLPFNFTFFATILASTAPPFGSVKNSKT